MTCRLLLVLFLGLNLSLNAAASSQSSSNPITDLSLADLDWIGDRIFKNEANRQVKYLTHWNKGEGFPSFGIGHFIWFPSSYSKTIYRNIQFVETFPAMVSFVSRTSPAPIWLQQLSPVVSPWRNRVAFEQAKSGDDLTQLRAWLVKTKSLQAQFIYQQFLARWDVKMQRLSRADAEKMQTQLKNLTSTKEGVFVVIDYFNFKGLGLNVNESYNGFGWGLLDVFAISPSALNIKLFVSHAKTVLQRRINLSPKKRNEHRWKQGWFVRLNSY